jgi:uncharacterized phage protein (TIGR01671 family)
MTREIKFRAWTDNLKDWWEMYYQYLDKYLNPIFTPAWYWLNNPTLKIMQYTWLKDKNWKEIYEGDIFIIKTMQTAISFEWQKVIWVVTLLEWIYWILGNDFFFPLRERNNERKIIWNIYENPDLLPTNQPDDK